MANNGKGAVAGTLLALVLIGYSCGHDDSSNSSSSSVPPSSSPTVASVETFADITLSDGRKVHNTLVDSVASTVVSSSSSDSTADDEARNTCITAALNRWAADNLVGRQIGNVQEDSYSSSYAVAPMAGYSRARVYFLNGSSSYYDVMSDLSTARSTAYSSCSASSYSPPTTTETPAPTTTQAPVYVAPDPDPDVYVDAPDYDAPSRHTGDSGHPCLPGERDGDGDGYCGET